MLNGIVGYDGTKDYGPLILEEEERDRLATLACKMDTFFVVIFLLWLGFNAVIGFFFWFDSMIYISYPWLLLIAFSSFFPRAFSKQLKKQNILKDKIRK